MYGREWLTLYVLTRLSFAVSFPKLRSNEENNNKNTLEWAEYPKTVRHDITNIISFLTWYNELINEDQQDNLNLRGHFY